MNERLLRMHDQDNMKQTLCLEQLTKNVFQN